MLTLTFAGDESGDISFAFDKGASRYFVVAVIATTDADSLREHLAALRRQQSLPTTFEFSFNALTSTLLRRRVFETLATADFEGWAVVVDKTVLPDSFRVMHRLDLYLYFVTELIRFIPADKREGATLILDEYGSAEMLRRELRRFLVARNIPRHFHRITIRRSQSESLIQIADLVAGAILRRDARKDSESFDLVAGKLTQVFEFHA